MRTLGRVAYEAFITARFSSTYGLHLEELDLRWESGVTEEAKHAWEIAARAVIASQVSIDPEPRAHS